MFGRETTLPVDLMYGIPVDVDTTKVVSINDFVERMLDKAVDDFRLVCENLGRLAERRKIRYDTKVTSTSLQPNQRVWYFCPRRFSQRSPKWQNL